MCTKHTHTQIVEPVCCRSLLSDIIKKVRDIYYLLCTPVSKPKLPVSIMVWAKKMLKYSSLPLFTHNIFIKIKNYTDISVDRT